MLSVADNQRITRVGPGTPMGEVFRRYWIPAALSMELPEKDGAPIRVRLLGEDLIAFRDSSGKVGLLDAFCPHRRAPLFFGRNEDCGLRCVYHGWKFDRDGVCVDMPSEPPDSLFKTKVAIAAYPTWEGGGIVWTYMGQPVTMPPPPDYEFCRTPATHGLTSKTLEHCNYLQALEGGLDAVHAMILHNEDIGDLSFLSKYDTLVPKIEVEKTDYGYYYIGIRSLGEQQWVRVYQFVMPVTQIRASILPLQRREDHLPRIEGHLWVPLDDENCHVYNYFYSADPATPISPREMIEIEALNGRGPDDLLADFSLRQNKQNDYLIDRQRQKTKSFSGVPGINTQDWALQENMGTIVDRSKEHLGSTDRAIIVMRQMLLEATYEVARGSMPRGSNPSSYRNVRPADSLIPRNAEWKETIPKALQARF